MRLDEPLRNFIPYVQIVENRIAGDTREHPHVNDEPEVGLEEITTRLLQARFWTAGGWPIVLTMV
jgi:hypothetical protein